MEMQVDSLKVTIKRLGRLALPSGERLSDIGKTSSDLVRQLWTSPNYFPRMGR